jgi:hypothetical protein
VDDLIALLSGRWTVHRRLVDLRSGCEGDFAGTASFEPEADRLQWAEAGRLRFGGHEGPAVRRLSIARGPDGWMVEFDDGRPFHPLDLATGACTVEHRCGDDLYAGEYRLLGPDAFDVRWRVTGPRKDQEIHTTYRRIAAYSRIERPDAPGGSAVDA